MALRKILFLVVHIAICTSVGYAKLPTKIVNGEEAPNTPYYVGILHNNNIICGGSIIDVRHIITAAHCFTDKNGVPITMEQYSQILVLTGTNDKMNWNGNNVYSVLRPILHQAYAVHDNWRNDIALLKLNRNILFNELVSPILLPASDTSVGTLVTLTGWGETRDFRPYAENLPRYLRRINEVVISQEQCQMMMPNRIQERQICAWGRGQGGACVSDSGGPLVDGMVLVGIVSFGCDCSLTFPDVYTRVSYYVPWIQETIAQSYLYNE